MQGSSALAIAAALDRLKTPEGRMKPKQAAPQVEMRRTPPPPAGAGAQRYPSATAGPSWAAAGSRPVKVTLPKGKAGAAGRSAAMAPQVNITTSLCKCNCFSDLAVGLLVII